MIELGCGVDPIFARMLVSVANARRVRIISELHGQTATIYVHPKDVERTSALVLEVWEAWKATRLLAGAQSQGVQSVAPSRRVVAGIKRISAPVLPDMEIKAPPVGDGSLGIREREAQRINLKMAAQFAIGKMRLVANRPDIQEAADKLEEAIRQY